MNDQPIPPDSRAEFRQMIDWRDLTGLLIVEPDLESWMPMEQAMGQVALITDEIDNLPDEYLDLYPRIWLGAIDGDEGLFQIEGQQAHIHLYGALAEESEVWEFFDDVLAGIARRQPDSVLGIIGATREVEVRQAAEAVAKHGLRAVVLEPLCLSSALFMDLDETIAEADRQRFARRVLTGEDWSPLDDVLQDEDDSGGEEEVDD